MSWFLSEKLKAAREFILVVMAGISLVGFIVASIKWVSHQEYVSTAHASKIGLLDMTIEELKNIVVIRGNDISVISTRVGEIDKRTERIENKLDRYIEGGM